MATATPKTTAKRAAKTAAKIEKTAETMSADAFKSVEDYAAAAREQFEEIMSKFTYNAEEMREKAEDFAADMRVRFEKHQKLAADVNAELVEAAKTEASDAVNFVSELGQAKSFTDALEIQQAYWSNLFETRMARAKDMTEKSVAAAKETFSTPSADFSAFFDMSAFEKMFPFPTKS